MRIYAIGATEYRPSVFAILVNCSNLAVPDKSYGQASEWNSIMTFSKGKFYRYLSYARTERARLLNSRKRNLAYNHLAWFGKHFYDL